MKRVTSAILASALLNCASAAVPGTPEPAHPGPPPALWAMLGNDDLTLQGANGSAKDDHRTNEVTLGLRIDAAVLAIDHSILTDRYRRTRSDELTITLGWLPLDGGAGGDAPWMAVGAGARFVGNLYGDAIQGRWHRMIDMNAYKLTYDNDQVDAVGYACGALPWFPTDNYGGEVLVSGLASTATELQADVAVRAIIRSDSRWTKLWAGGRWRSRSGGDAGPTARAVATFERGLCVDVGWQLPFLSLHALHDLESGESFGTVALELPRW